MRKPSISAGKRRRRICWCSIVRRKGSVSAERAASVRFSARARNGVGCTFPSATRLRSFQRIGVDIKVVGLFLSMSEGLVLPNQTKNLAHYRSDLARKQPYSYKTTFVSDMQ